MKIQVNKELVDNLKVGDTVTRLLSGIIRMQLKITEITDTEIICGEYRFNKSTLAEIDEDLGWDGITITGSYLKLK